MWRCDASIDVSWFLKWEKQLEAVGTGQGMHLASWLGLGGISPLCSLLTDYQLQLWLHLCQQGYSGSLMDATVGIVSHSCMVSGAVVHPSCAAQSRALHALSPSSIRTSSSGTRICRKGNISRESMSEGGEIRTWKEGYIKDVIQRSYPRMYYFWYYQDMRFTNFLIKMMNLNT